MKCAFKNAVVYTITGPVTDLYKKWSEEPGEIIHARKPGELEESTMGLLPVLGDVFHRFANKDWFSVCFYDRVISKSELYELTDEWIKNNPGATWDEQDAARAAIYDDLLRKGNINKKIVYGYIDLQKNTIVIGNGIYSTAERMLAILRKSFGTLPVVPYFDHSLTDDFRHLIFEQEDTNIGNICHLKLSDGSTHKIDGPEDLRESACRLEDTQLVELIELVDDQGNRFNVKQSGEIKKMTPSEELAIDVENEYYDADNEDREGKKNAALLTGLFLSSSLVDGAINSVHAIKNGY